MIKARLLDSTVSEFLSSGKYWETSAPELAELVGCPVSTIQAMKAMGVFKEETVKEYQTSFWYKMPVCLHLAKKYLEDRDGKSN